jgi:prefoldin subunit 5
MSDIDPQDFGELKANVTTLTKEIHLLRQEMAQVNAMINQGKGGIYVLVLAAGAIGSTITLAVKKLFGG